MNRYITLGILFGLILILLAGCTAMPKQLQIQDSDQSFPVDTILATQTQSTLDVDQLADELKGAALVFIGEIHSSTDHHANQLKLLRALFQRHPRLKVGMEMFDRSYQPVLDLWSQARIDEDQLIRQTHWYANWRFDFSLYREILAYIRENRIPLVGLDLPTYIPRRIRVGGIENLSPADRQWLPREIPPGDSDHRAFMERTFNRHRFLGHSTNFEDFYMAQCARDATMARTIADSMGDDPMLVLIGGGHIRHGKGVPWRAKAYSGKNYKTVYLSPVGETVPLNIADYIWVTPEVSARPRR